MQSTEIDFEDNFMDFRYEGNGTVFENQKNVFKENDGVTIQNPSVGIPAYIISLNIFGSSILCGHTIENIVGSLKNMDLESVLLIMDFSGITEVSQSFVTEYIKFILSTKSKVISINQNTNISNAITQYVGSIIDIQEVTE